MVDAGQLGQARLRGQAGLKAGGNEKRRSTEQQHRRDAKDLIAQGAHHLRRIGDVGHHAGDGIGLAVDILIDDFREKALEGHIVDLIEEAEHHAAQKGDLAAHPPQLTDGRHDEHDEGGGEVQAVDHLLLGPALHPGGHHKGGQHAHGVADGQENGVVHFRARQIQDQKAQGNGQRVGTGQRNETADGQDGKILGPQLWLGRLVCFFLFELQHKTDDSLLCGNSLKSGSTLSTLYNQL